MRISTIFVLVLAILLTVVIMQNTDQVKFTLLFTDMYLSKMVVLASVAVVAFILGIIIGRPRKARYVEPVEHDDELPPSRPGRTLSDEDRDYIS